MQLEKGKNYFVRTEGDHWVGRLVDIDGPTTVTLEDAAWIADSGRLHIFLAKGKADSMEIEPVPDGQQIMLHWRAIIEWPHDLFRKPV